MAVETGGGPPVSTQRLDDSYVLAAGSTTARKLEDRFADIVNVKDFGAVGDGSTTDTVAIQAAVTYAAGFPGATVWFPPVATSYKMGQVTIPTCTDLSITGNGTKLTLSGASAGFWLSSSATVAGFRLEGLDATGDASAASAQALLQNNSGATITDIRVLNNRVTSTTIGISVNADLGGSINGALIQGNRVVTVVGGSSGQGYGIHVATGQATAAGIRIVDNTVDGAQRHGIYVGRGVGVTVSGNHVLNHRATLAGGDAHGVERPAISIGRSTDVVVSDNVIASPYDGAIDVFSDSTGTTVTNVTVSKNVVRNWRSFPAITIGSSAPATDGSPQGVILSGNQVVNDLAVTGGTGGAASALRVYCAKQLTVEANHIELLGATTGPESIGLYASGESGASATYSDHWRFLWNTVTSSGASPAYVYRIESAASASAIRMDFIGLKAVSTSSTFFYVGTQSTGYVTVQNHPTDGFDLVKARRPSPIAAVSGDRGDANQTLTVGSDAQVQRWATTLTAARTVTLSTTGAVNGDTFRVVRTGVGAFGLDVGGLRTMLVPGWTEVVYDGSAWQLSAWG